MYKMWMHLRVIFPFVALYSQCSYCPNDLVCLCQLGCMHYRVSQCLILRREQVPTVAPLLWGRGVGGLFSLGWLFSKVLFILSSAVKMSWIAESYSISKAKSRDRLCDHVLQHDLYARRLASRIFLTSFSFCLPEDKEPNHSSATHLCAFIQPSHLHVLAWINHLN